MIRWSTFGTLLIVATLISGLSLAEDPPAAESAKRAKGVTSEAGGVKHFGAAFGSQEAITFKTLVSDTAKFTGKTVKVRGHVKSVCKKKGCWMVLSSAADSEPTIRIRMKDYGFFVPTNCKGKSSIVEGVFSRKLVSESMRKHLAEDAEKDPSKVTGDKEELTLMATAIDIF